ncbi:MAG: hypothetical protein M1817_006900 [Caeruleum heppii]|nr:MAG: hypothetical protein M1817_006900 [Caeruleum heppii]
MNEPHRTNEEDGHDLTPIPIRAPEDVGSVREISDPESDPTAIIEKPDAPPDGGYGWVCVACCFWINAHTWGLNSSYGVFLAHYLATNTYPGATYLEFAFVGGLSISQALLISPIATTTVRLYGTRATLLIGVFLETLSLVGASFATEIWQLILSQGICFGWGMGFQFIGSVGVVPQWFTKRRSVANGIGTAGSGIGGLIYSLASNAMIQRLGVPWAFRILAIVQFVVNLVCAILIRDRNKQIGTTHLAFDYRLFKRMEFWLLLGWGFFSLLGYIVLLFSLPNYALSIGLTPQQGSVVGALFNLGQGLGRPVVGYFSDAAGRINIVNIFTLVKLISADEILGRVHDLFVGLVLFRHLDPWQELRRSHLLFASSGHDLWDILDVSEAIGLQLRQESGNIYLHAQIFTAFMYIAAAICMWFLRAWKIGQLEEVTEGSGGHVRGRELRTTTSNATGASKSSRVRRLTMPKRV